MNHMLDFFRALDLVFKGSSKWMYRDKRNNASEVFDLILVAGGDGEVEGPEVMAN